MGSPLVTVIETTAEFEADVRGDPRLGEHRTRRIPSMMDVIERANLATRDHGSDTVCLLP